MPELPEVETIRRGLSRHILGREIASLGILRPNLRYPFEAQKLRRQLIGRKIVGLERRSKYLIFELESSLPKRQATRLVVHLGMTGKLLLRAADEPLGKHEHFILKFANEAQELRYDDARRFGFVTSMLQSELPTHPYFAALGPEPLSEAFNANYLQVQCQASKRSIKTLIMDAKVVVGVGNIYASEALFRARINPVIQARRISCHRVEELVRTIRATLNDAIEQGGTTLQDYRQVDGSQGYFKVALAVYGREGEACRNCQTAIRRRVLGQRATFYCPQCQAR